MGDGVKSFHAFSGHATLQHLPYKPSGSSLKPVLLSFYWGLITWAWLIKSLATGDSLNLQPLSPLWKFESGAESSNPLITVTLGDQHPSWSYLGNSSHQSPHWQTKGIPGIPSILVAVCQEMEGRPNTDISLYHYLTRNGQVKLWKYIYSVPYHFYHQHPGQSHHDLFYVVFQLLDSLACTLHQVCSNSRSVIQTKSGHCSSQNFAVAPHFTTKA
jgi:hypothetical protein